MDPLILHDGYDAQITQLVKQVNDTTWLLGDHLLKRSPYQSESATWNDAAENASYTLTKCDGPLPDALMPLQSQYFKLIRAINVQSAVWAIGSCAIYKLKKIDSQEKMTSESDILKYVRARNPSFNTPLVYYHLDYDSHSHLFEQKLPGRTLDETWPTLTDQQKTACAERVAQICEETAQWTRETFGGINSSAVAESYLTGGTQDYCAKTMLQNCRDIGMDCSTFHFCHVDLGPTNLIVEKQIGEETTPSLSVIDFENAGFYPKDWIMAKFRVSGGMELDHYPAYPQQYRARVAGRLKLKNFRDLAENWVKW